MPGRRPSARGPSAATPAISVVMPVYNALPYLDHAIESIVAQTFPDVKSACF